MTLSVVLNSSSGRGKAGRIWPELGQILKARYGDYQLQTTRGPGDATGLAREALRQGADWILAVGGDGTLNEVLNGFFETNGELINPAAQLSVLMVGTGGDFKRSLGLSRDPQQALEQILERPARRLDIGRIELSAADGQPLRRYFINIASFGMGGDVSTRLNQSRLAARLGGKAGFLLSTLETIVQFRGQPVRILLDSEQGELELKTRIYQVAVANGRYHGGGMHVAPHAQLEDGLFEVIILPDCGLSHSLRSFGKVYSGRHLTDPQIYCLQAQRLVAEPLGPEPVLLEVDGETPGRLPARFEILPQYLNFKG